MTTPTTSSPADVLRFIAGAGVLGLDLETTGLNPRTDRARLLSLANGKQALVLDLFEHPNAVPSILDALKGKILIAHNAAFDLGFLWHLGLTDLPECVDTWLLSMLLNAGADGFGFGGTGYNGLAACALRHMNVTLPKELQASDWSGPLSIEQIEYARRDAEVLPPLMRQLEKEIDKAGLHGAADIELRALPAFVWLAQSGTPFDQDAWISLAARAAQRKADLTARLDAAAPQKGQDGLFGPVEFWNWDSPAQVKTVLGKLLKIDLSTTNDAMLALLDHPTAELVREHRHQSTLLKMYGPNWLGCAEITGGRLFADWRQLGTLTGRTSCATPNCFSADTEILTEAGWVPFPELPRGLPVAQWDAGRIEFVLPTAYHAFNHTGTMLELQNEHIDLCVTPDHRCPLRPRRRKTEGLRVFEARDYPEDWLQIHAGVFAGGDRVLPEALLALIVATQADGSWHDNGIDFTFHRERKFVRLVSALKALGADYSESVRWGHKRLRVRVLAGPVVEQVRDFLGTHKEFGPWILTLPRPLLTFFCEEVFLWDGCSTRRSQYGSGVRKNADWVQIAHLLSGHRANVRPYDASKWGGKRINYQVDLTRRDYSMTTNIGRAYTPANGTVYCVSVPSGLILVRRNGKACVTGNCQQIPRDEVDGKKVYRAAFRPPPGKVLVKADYSTLQMRIACLLARDEALGAVFLAGEDVHTATARRTLGKAEPSKADRQIAKSQNFGLLFGMSAEGLRIYAKTTYGVTFTKAEAERHRSAFFAAYPGLARWHQATRNGRASETRTVSGRRRLLHNQTPDTERLNSPVQGIEADGAKTALALLWERRRECPSAQPVLFAHDEICFEVDEADGEKARDWLVRCMLDGMQPLLKPVPVKVDAKVCQSWGD